MTNFDMKHAETLMPFPPILCTGYRNRFTIIRPLVAGNMTNTEYRCQHQFTTTNYTSSDNEELCILPNG